MSEGQMNRHGHSLIEMMMVLGIVGMAAAAAAPAFRERIPHRRLEQASWQIYMDLQRAKAQAVSENCLARVTVNAASAAYRIWVDTNDNGIEDDGETILRDLSAIAPGIRLSAHPSTMTLTPSGTMNANGYYFFMRVQEQVAGTKDIYVFPNGHIDPYRVQES